MRCNLTVCAGMVAASSATAAPTAYHTAVSTANPILWFQFNETAGNAINHGSLGASHNATYNGTIVRSVFTNSGDTGAGFNSPDDYLESLAASTLTGNPTFSIEAIVRLDQQGSANLWGPFLHWGSGGTGHEVYFSISNADNNRLYAGFYNAGQRTSSPVSTNRWLHVVWVRQGGTDTAAGTTLWVNGRIVTLQQDPGLIPGFLPAASVSVTATNFHINRASDFLGSRYFTGALDELALYNRALSPAEILGLAAASGLSCYANCDDSVLPPILNVNDFTCFANRFAAGDPYANCDLSTTPPVLNVNDFTCFLNQFAAGCP